jgi:hypothetical protein
LRTIEQIHRLIDGAADDDHDLIVEMFERAGLGIPQLGVVLNQPLRDRHRLERFALHAGACLCGKIRARRNRQQKNRTDRHRDEGGGELAVEARSHFAQQRPAAQPTRRQRADDGGSAQQQHVEQTGEHHQLGEIQEMSEGRDDRVAERVDAAPIAEEVDTKRLIVAGDGLPEGLPGLHEPIEHVVRQRPHRGTG